MKSVIHWAVQRALKELMRLARAKENDGHRETFVRDLARVARQRGDEAISATDRAALQRSLRTTQNKSTRAVIEHLLRAQEEAQQKGLRTVSNVIRKFEGTSPLDDNRRIEEMLNSRRAELAKRAGQYVRRTAKVIQRDVSKKINYLYTSGEPARSAVEKITSALEGHDWRIERVLRTEILYAHNAAERDAIRVASRTYPDMMMRWTERINDTTGQPMDKRVALDSMVLHGQLAPPGGSFVMPNDPNVDTRTWGKSWDHPPNRPHDRAILTPWRRSWGIPGWVIRNGTKASLSR